MLEASRILKEKKYKFKVILVGGGLLLSGMRDLASELGLDEHVEFSGWVNNSSLPDFYNRANCLVVPSFVDCNGETEGMPVVIQEAFACGLPVIASSVSGIPDLIKNDNNGWLCSPADPIDLAKKMEYVLSQGDLSFFAHNAFLASKANSYEIISKKYSDAIEEIC